MAGAAAAAFFAGLGCGVTCTATTGGGLFNGLLGKSVLAGNLGATLATTTGVGGKAAAGTGKSDAGIWAGLAGALGELATISLAGMRHHQ
jgi:hypothetical protein